MSKEKSSVKSLLLGKWNTKTIVGVAIGAALFGVLMVFGGIKVATNTSLSSAMVVVVVVGALFGPLPAALAAGLGNVIADLISGYGFWFDWSIGNAVLGFFVGLLPLYGARIEDGVFQVKHAIIYTILCIIGNALAFRRCNAHIYRIVFLLGVNDYLDSGIQRNHFQCIHIGYCGYTCIVPAC